MELQTQSHLHTLRELLLYRQRELRAEVHAAQISRQQDEPSGAEVTDLKDGAAQEQRQHTEDLQASRDLDELREVEGALARLDAGNYGDCAECGDAIPAARLMAQPAARLCAPCQTAVERCR